MSPTTRTFEARLDAIAAARAFVEELCGPAGVDRRDRLCLGLVIEELFTNTVVHGHGGDCDAPITVTLDVRPERIGVTYEDTAPPFDPLAVRATPAANPEDRPVGKLGLVLVRGLAVDLAYARHEGRNRLSLTLPLGAPGG